MSEKAELTPPYFIMEDARVGEAYLDSNAILGRGSVVGNGSYVGESLLMDRVVVGENSFLKNVIVGDNSKIGNGTTSGRGLS